MIRKKMLIEPLVPMKVMELITALSATYTQKKERQVNLDDNLSPSVDWRVAISNLFVQDLMKIDRIGTF